MPDRLLSRQASVQFWGDSRVALNRAAWELARRINDEYAWLEIGDPAEETDPGDPGANGLVPEEQLFRTLPPEEFRPDDGVANLATWSVLRGGQPVEAVDALLDFVRLPPRVQEDLPRLARRGRPGVYVMANTDRVFGFYPDNPSENRRQLNAFRREGVTLIVTVAGVPKSDRAVYDYVFEVRTPPETPWIESEIVCEWAPEEESEVPSAVPFPAFSRQPA